MPSAEYTVENDELVVDYSYAGATGTYEVNASIYASGNLDDSKQYEDTGNIPVGGSALTGTFEVDLGGLGIDPGETIDVFVTVVVERVSTGEIDQLQETVEVTRPIDTGEILIDCAGVSPRDPHPEDVINVSVDYNDTGDLSQPTVTFEAVLDGDTVSQIYTEENTVGGDGTITLTPILDSGHQPGDEIDISVEATDISPTGPF